MAKPRLGVVLFQLGLDTPEAIEPFSSNSYLRSGHHQSLPCMAGAQTAGVVVLRIAGRAWLRSTTRPSAVNRPFACPTERQARALERALALQRELAASSPCAIGNRSRRTRWRSAPRRGRASAAAALPALFLRHHAEQPEGMAPCSSQKHPASHLTRDRGRGISFHPLTSRALVGKVDTTFARFDDPAQGASGLQRPRPAAQPDRARRSLSAPGRGDRAAVLARGRWSNPHVLCFQSRVGRQKWLEPSLTRTLERLPREGKKRLLVIPISFVTEHIETLHEINIEAREDALAAALSNLR